MRLKSVVLPAPFGPTRQRSSPASMLKLRSLVAVRPPKRLTRAFVSRIGDIVDAPRLSTPGCEAREHRSLGDRGRQGERVVERGVARCDTIALGGTPWPWRDRHARRCGSPARCTISTA